ncbi:transmembrane protein, putative [Medicago truncatula]|uniref:Transmembrane protein, putative n=1 Tax=Medicago truncatula TaxID=3880 RepID=A0A072TXA6_MEDTR|nr:transmembrane protein, putative [Medicago truncatula]
MISNTVYRKEFRELIKKAGVSKPGQRPPQLFFGKIRVTLHPIRTRTSTILRIFRPHSISLVWLLARFPDFIVDNLLCIFKASAALGCKGFNLVISGYEFFTFQYSRSSIHASRFLCGSLVKVLFVLVMRRWGLMDRER